MVLTWHHLPVVNPVYVIISPMTKLLSEALQKVAELPEARQDDAAHILLALIDSDAKPYHLSVPELQEIELAIADVDAEHFASEKEVMDLLEHKWA